MNPALPSVIEAIAELDTAYRDADDAATVSAAGALLGAFDHAARSGEPLTLTAAALAAAIHRDDAPEDP